MNIYAHSFLLSFSLFFATAQSAECTTTVTTTTAIHPKKTIPKQNQKQLIKHYFSTITPGLIVGGATGYLEHYIESHFNMSMLVARIFFMLLEANIRFETIVALQKDFDEYDINYNKDLMHLAARIASWITYLMKQ